MELRLAVSTRIAIHASIIPSSPTVNRSCLPGRRFREGQRFLRDKCLQKNDARNSGTLVSSQNRGAHGHRPDTKPRCPPLLVISNVT